MKKTIICGCTVFSRHLRYTMEHDAKIDIASYCVSSEYMKEKEFDGRPIVPFEKLNDIFGKDNFRVLITVGYRGMNTGREKVFYQCEELRYEIASFIESTARVDAEYIGRGNIILGNSCLQPFSRIGDGNLMCDALVGHGSTVENFNYLAPRCTVAGLTKIGNNCFIGIGACIGDNISVGDYTLIGAGTTLTKSIDSNSVVAAPIVRVKKGRPEILGGIFK